MNNPSRIFPYLKSWHNGRGGGMDVGWVCEEGREGRGDMLSGCSAKVKGRGKQKGIFHLRRKRCSRACTSRMRNLPLARSLALSLSHSGNDRERDSIIPEIRERDRALLSVRATRARSGKSTTRTLRASLCFFGP